MATPSCPRCGTEVGSTWRWCLACGYDPDGTQNRIRDAHVEAHLKKGSWTPVVIVLIGLLIGAAVLWRTVPDDDNGTPASPTTAAVMAWAPYTPEDNGFRADFPATPHAEQAVSPGDSWPQRTYLVLVNREIFGVVVTDTGRAELDQGVSAEEAQKTMTSFLQRSTVGSGGGIESTAPTRVGIAPALDYTLQSSPLGRTRGRLVLLGREIYNVMVAGQPEDDHVDRFVGSFALG